MSLMGLCVQQSEKKKPTNKQKAYDVIEVTINEVLHMD
jgi:hypothetical protein